MLRLLFATLATTIIMAGCNQDTATQDTSSGPAAEPPGVTSKDFGDYVVHFNAISTSQLQPEIAQKYNITRSKNRAMVNIAIIRKAEGTIGEPVSGDVKITANNLTGQVKDLALRRIQEGVSIYYIGDVQIADTETLVFNLTITPENETASHSVRFTQQFFPD